MRRELIGLAVPYNTANSYGETIAPGAFAGWLAKPRGAVPMLALHEDKWPCGEWVEFVDGSDGLHVRGVIDHPHADDILAELPQLSVTYCDEDRPDVMTFARMADLQCKIGIEPPAWLRNLACRRKTVSRAQIAEISLVDKGAFPGTGYRILDNGLHVPSHIKAAA